MYGHCLFCTADLGRNDAIEPFPIGRRLAFDPHRGRLWVVCRRCERWNLTPLEERWEAIEDCERRFRSARKRIATDQVGLAHLDEGLELVRIGDPLRPEFAAWRYGDQFGRRRRRRIIQGTAAAGAIGAGAIGALALGAVALGGIAAYHAASRVVRHRRDGKLVTAVQADDEDDVLVVRGEHLPAMQLAPSFDHGLGWRLKLAHTRGVTNLHGSHALHAASLIMPSINGTGASQHGVRRAIQRLEAFDDPVVYLRSAAAVSAHPSRPGDAATLMKLPVDVRLAVEMAVNEEHERDALEGEMVLLEMAWEEAEHLASIADSLVPPLEVEIQLAALRGRYADRRESS